MEKVFQKMGIYHKRINNMPKGQLFLFFIFILFSKGVLTNDEDSEKRSRSLQLNKVKKCTTDRYTSKKYIFVRIVFKILQFYLENIPHFQ